MRVFPSLSDRFNKEANITADTTHLPVLYNGYFNTVHEFFRQTRRQRTCTIRP
jgi:hypothetical protein